MESYISVGEMLTINSYSNGYYNVTVEETGVTGYISSANMEKIVSGTGDSLTLLNETAYVTNVTSDVDLREDATMNSTTLLKLTNNTQVTLLGKQGEWYKVDANETTGYIYEEYIAIANTSTSSGSSQSTATASNNSNVASSSGTTRVINSNNISSATRSTSSNNSATTATNSNSNNSTTTSNKENSSSGTTSTTKNTDIVSYSIPSGQYSPSTVVVKNTTGNAISEAQLNEYLRSWIMSSQDCNGICDATGTYWEQPWLNKVSQETLYQAFIDANEESALAQNITANEFIKATQKLDDLTSEDVPFTLSQAKTLIVQILERDHYGTASDITKIVLVRGTQSTYQVYFKGEANNYWTVDANSGYAHG